MMIKLISYSSNSSAAGIRFSQTYPLTELDRGALTQARNQKVRNHVSLFDDNYSGHFLFSVMRLPTYFFGRSRASMPAASLILISCRAAIEWPAIFSNLSTRPLGHRTVNASICV